MKIEDIQNIPAYVLNYENFPGKFAGAESELKKIPLLDIRRVTCIDGQKDKALVDERLSQLGCTAANFTRYGYAALGLTFLDTLQEFLSGTNEHMMTFEDDIILHSNFHEEFDKLHDLNLGDFDLLYFGAAPLGGEPKAVKERTEQLRRDGKHWVTVHTSMWQTHALLWNRASAGAYVEFAQNMMAADYYVSVVIPTKLMALKRPSLRAVCLIADRSTASNVELLKNTAGKYETCGLIYQGTDIPTGITLTERVTS